MSYLFTLCQTILGSLGRVASFIASGWGVLTTAIGGLVALFALPLYSWDISATFSSIITDLDTIVLGLISSVSSNSTDFLVFLCSFFGFDYLVSYFTLAVSATIGVIIFVFSTLLVTLVPLFFMVIVFRAIMKLIQVFTGGFVDV